MLIMAILSNGIKKEPRIISEPLSLVEMAGLEPATSSTPRRRSPSELHPQNIYCSINYINDLE